MKNLLVTLYFISLVMIGCSHQHKPSDFPNLYSYTFTVLFQGQPVEKAQVMFLPEQSGQGWAVGGKTNNRGIAEIYTHQGSYMKSGIPAGTFKVTIFKDPEELEQLAKSKEEMDKMTPEEDAQYNARINEVLKTAKTIVPAILSNRAKTPLKIIVSETENTFTVNLEQYQVKK
jgi:hypothetical protein